MWEWAPILIHLHSSVSDAGRFLRMASWRLEAALDAFYNAPTAVKAATSNRELGSNSASISKNLNKMWECYQGSFDHHLRRTLPKLRIRFDRCATVR